MSSSLVVVVVVIMVMVLERDKDFLGRKKSFLERERE